GGQAPPKESWPPGRNAIPDKKGGFRDAATSPAGSDARAPGQRHGGTRAGDLPRSAYQDDRAAGGGERGRCRRPYRHAEDGRQYGPADRDPEPAGRVRAD